MRVALGWLGRRGIAALGFLALLAGSCGVALAHQKSMTAPEIDAGSMANALMVLSGGLLIIRSRRARG